MLNHTSLLSLAFISFFSFSASAISYPSPEQFFLDTLQSQFPEKVEGLTAEKTKGSESFLKKVKEKNFSFLDPDIYEVNFKSEGIEHKCFGALILESERLSVVNLPKEYRDRASFVLLGECQKGGEEKEAIDFNTENYVVQPLDKTLPTSSLTKHESYELYKKIQKTRPSLLCVETDINSNKVPRTQTYMHEVGDYTIFSTVFNTSSVYSPQFDGTVEHVEDRAHHVSEDVDRGSVHEIKESLDFLVETIKGNVFLAFPSKQCFKLQQDGKAIVACTMKMEGESLKNNEGTLLKEVYVEFESRQVNRLLLGVGGVAKSLDEIHYSLKYMFTFGEADKKKIYTLKTRYEKSEVGSRDECKMAEF